MPPNYLAFYAAGWVTIATLLDARLGIMVLLMFLMGKC